MRLALVVLGLLAAPAAQAGGVGLIFTGGAHTESVWYHSNSIETTEGWFQLRDLKDYQKYEQVQTLPHLGTGVEFILGTREDRVTGVFRFNYLMDSAQKHPGPNAEVPSDYVVAAPNTSARHIGIGTVGLNFGILGDPSGFQAGISAHLGAGFLTTDHTEFLIADVGPMASYRLSRHVVAFAEVGYQMRFRKGWSHGINGTAGLRYMFD